MKPSGLGNYFVSKRFAIQTLLWSLKLVIKANLEHETIAVWLEMKVSQHDLTNLSQKTF